MYTTMAVNKGNFVQVKPGYGKHTILVEKVVCEKILVKNLKYRLHIPRGSENK